MKFGGFLEVISHSRVMVFDKRKEIEPRGSGPILFQVQSNIAERELGQEA